MLGSQAFWETPKCIIANSYCKSSCFISGAVQIVYIWFICKMHNNYIIIRDYTMSYVIIALLCCLKIKGLSRFLISSLLFLILTPNLLDDLSKWFLLYNFVSQLEHWRWTELCRVVSFAYEFYMQKMLSWEILFFFHVSRLIYFVDIHKLSTLFEMNLHWRKNSTPKQIFDQLFSSVNILIDSAAIWVCSLDAF